ncbi:MAG: PRC-barrel domain-containing protein [Nitrospira sp.]|nr:PRC-barrel domain-containing protein [Nitrospira sp.]
MTRQMAIYAGTIALLFATSGPAFSKDRTDITEGKGVPEEYSDTPVRQGKLIEMKDSKYINATVQNQQGEAIGKITDVLKDKTTGDIEYVVFQAKDTKRTDPIRWSQFETKGDHLQLKLNKQELNDHITKNVSQDQSPDLKEYMDQIKKVRSQSPSSSGASTGIPGQKGELAVGEMGEESVSGANRSGTSGLPPGKAPGFEGGNPSSKR